MKFQDINRDLSNYSLLQVSEEDVVAAIKSFSTGSAGGLDSLRPSHIQDMISHSSGSAGQKLISSIKNLCNFHLSGKVNLEICPLFFGASLCALQKKHGGIRPIAVGTFYRRYVAKLCCMKIKEDLGSLLRPLQFGFSTPGGCEAVAHSARRYINQHPDPSSKVFLKLDFKNAFNMIDRNGMLLKVRDNLPGIYPFVNQCYNSSSYLNFGDHLITSERGVQQGDSLGSALFCLTIEELTKSLSSEFNCWYLDDGSIAGDSNTVLEDLDKVIIPSKQIGLELNFNKSELISLLDPKTEFEFKFQSLAPGIKFLEKSDCSLLGAPLSKNSLSGHIRNKKDSLQLLFTRLNELPTHISFFLLRNCLAIPKLM
ncbi:hypothetical protein JTB14_008873 [Gonioctena quinquepunctata]|nr:hypothetical protein JTB14_008873 [Gonioctena quinquepunctata]